jgi:hypothetical protein
LKASSAVCPWCCGIIRASALKCRLCDGRLQGPGSKPEIPIELHVEIEERTDGVPSLQFSLDDEWGR